MPSRDRDTGRRRNPEPEWDEYEAEEEYTTVYDEPAAYSQDDLPEWGNQGGYEEPQNQQPSRATRQPEPAPRRRSTAPLPELSRSLPRPGQAPAAQPQSQTHSTPTRQPTDYDVPIEDEWPSEGPWETERVTYDDEYFDDFENTTAPPRRSRDRPRGRPRSTPRAPSMPPALAAAFAAQDRSVLYFIGISAVSILLMAVMLAARVGELPGAIPIHLDASGVPDLWGTPSTLWRVVLAAVMITIMNAIVAWFLSPRDPFIGRFVVGSSLLAQVLAWIALFLLLW